MRTRAPFVALPIARRAVVVGVLIVGVVGLGLSLALASFSQDCIDSFYPAGSPACGPWYFDPSWHLWLSIAGFVAMALALALARWRWPRGFLLVAAIAACVAASPVPIELLFDPVAIPVLRG